MGKITCRPKAKKRRSNSIQNESDQQKAEFSASTPSTPSSLSLNTLASDGSHIVSPALCHNNIGQLTINSKAVFKGDNRKRTHESQAQDEFSDTDASGKMTPKQFKKSRRSPCSITRRSLIPFSEARVIMGEITGALVTSEYHCSECSFRIPSWSPLSFNVKCPSCKTSWKCSKVPCTCKAKITLEQSSGQTQRVTLEDALLRSIVSFKPQGYCNTDMIEKQVLKVGSVRVVFNDGVVKNVMKFSSSPMSPSDMLDVVPTDSD